MLGNAEGLRCVRHRVDSERLPHVARGWALVVPWSSGRCCKMPWLSQRQSAPVVNGQQALHSRTSAAAWEGSDVQARRAGNTAAPQRVPGPKQVPASGLPMMERCVLLGRRPP